MDLGKSPWVGAVGIPGRGAAGSRGEERDEREVGKSGRVGSRKAQRHEGRCANAKERRFAGLGRGSEGLASGEGGKKRGYGGEEGGSGYGAIGRLKELGTECGLFRFRGEPQPRLRH